MELIYTAPNPLLVGHAANLLEAAGVEVERRHFYLAGGAGDLPLNEVWPELWVEPSERARAERLLQQLQQPTPHTPWVCPSCGEPHAGQFTHCWRCGTANPTDTHAAPSIEGRP